MEKYPLHFHRDGKGRIIQLHFTFPIPFGHGWSLSYLLHFAEFRKEHGLVEIAILPRNGEVIVL